jgi:lysophospholipid acyltransferase (LPLAT)-like uncharacterized protein
MSGNAHPWWLPAAAAAAAWLVRVWGRTWRIEIIHDGGRAPAPVIYAFWHARLLALTYVHRGGGGAVLISRHADGELIARIVERLGFVTARGSSTRGGSRAVLELLERIREGRVVGITPDGPRGPALQFKEGAIQLASLSGAPLVPVAPGMASCCRRPSRAWPWCTACRSRFRRTSIAPRSKSGGRAPRPRSKR